MNELENIIKFEETVVRRVWHNSEWYFSIIDTCQILTKTKNARRYWSDLKRKLLKEGNNQLYEIIVQLKMLAPNGKLYETDAVNTAGLLRIIQSIPSPKAEPFKQWLAEVGYERIQEIENPELAIERIRNLYRAKGHDENWIRVRLHGIGVRKGLTDEWRIRGVKKGVQYAILTAEISQATFGLKPSQHKKLKGLKRHNLRDHMTQEELLFTILGEIGTTSRIYTMDAQGFEENKIAAQKGGKAASKALAAYEKEMGEKVLSSKNHLDKIAEKKKLKNKKNDSII